MCRRGTIARSELSVKAGQLHCIVEKAGQSADWGALNIGTYMTDTPIMKHTTIRSSAWVGACIEGASMDSCTVTGNANHGIVITGAGSVTNCISVSNSGYGVFGNPDSCPTVSCCDIWNNAIGNYGGALSDQTGLNGNISEDPLFCSLVDGDYHLYESSPCIDGYGCGQIGAYGVGCNHCNGMELWSALSVSLPDSMQDMGATALRDFLYASGGLIAGGRWTDRVLYTRALGENTGPWTATAALPDSVRDHQMISVGDWVYSIGGSEGAVGTPGNPIHRQVHDDVWKGEPSAGGDIGSWATEASLPVPLWGFGAAVWDDRIYVAGGSQRDSVLARPADRIYYADIDPLDGSLQGWTESGAGLPIAVTSLELVARQGKLWAIGGQQGPPSGVIHPVGALSNASLARPTLLIISSAVFLQTNGFGSSL